MLDPTFEITEVWEDACSIEAIHLFLDHDLSQECIDMMEEVIKSNLELSYDADACSTVFSHEFSTIENYATTHCGISKFKTPSLLQLSKNYMILKSLVNWKIES